ncbi:MAG: hypothetical protein GXP45_06925 [bacterium]|nr:hypothetical protein [bacterium]
MTYLKAIDSSYENISLTGGRYMDCDNRSSNTIYGQIDHSLGSSHYKLVAGVVFNNSENSYLQNFDNSLIYENSYWEGKLFDSW